MICENLSNFRTKTGSVVWAAKWFQPPNKRFSPVKRGKYLFCVCGYKQVHTWLWSGWKKYAKYRAIQKWPRPIKPEHKACKKTKQNKNYICLDSL